MTKRMQCTALSLSHGNSAFSSNYKLFLKHMRKKLVFSTTHKNHPRHWIPAPCKTSSPQKSTYRKCSLPLDHISLPSLFDMKGELGKLIQDYQQLKIAQAKVESCQPLTPLQRSLVQKWKSRRKKESRISHVGGKNDDKIKSLKSDRELRKNSKFYDGRNDVVKKYFTAADKEEEQLRKLLKRFRIRDKNRNDSSSKREKCKKCYFQYAKMQRKQQDLLHYLTKVENESSYLKKENKVLRNKLYGRGQDSMKKNFSLSRELVTDPQVEDSREASSFPSKLRTNEFLRSYGRENTLQLSTDLERSSNFLFNTSRNQAFDTTYNNDSIVDEEKWVIKLKEMRMIYEKAILGYKEELKSSVARVSSLENELHVLNKQHEKDKKDITFRYESEIEKVKSEFQCEPATLRPISCTLDHAQKDDRALQLLLKEKDKEIKSYKQILLKFDSELIRNFEKIVMKNLSPSKTDSIIDKMKVALEAWWDGHKADIHSNFSVAQNSSLEDSFTKVQEQTLNKLETAFEKLSHDNVGNTVRKHQDTNSKLLELNSELSVANTKNEELRMKLKSLESEIEIKDKILEKNSDQLETRIREYSFLSSKLEQLKSTHSKEIALLKALNDDSRSKPSIQELQLHKDRLEAQLDYLKRDGLMNEKNSRKKIRNLESELSRLNVHNSDLLSRLERIQSSYNTLFHSVHTIPSEVISLSQVIDSNLTSFPLQSSFFPTPALSIDQNVKQINLEVTNK